MDKTSKLLRTPAIIALLYTLPALASDPIVGTWSGTAHQHPVGSSASYPVQITLDSSTSGTSHYPTLGCGGTLSGSGGDGIYRYHETITSGRATEDSDGCIDTEIEITLHGNILSWRSTGSWDGETYRASGTLSRAGANPAEWRRGNWRRWGSSEAGPTGLCVTTWVCEPGESPRSPEEEILKTEALRTKGACQVTDNVEECGRCVSNPPEQLCKYCIQPSQCSNPNLGPRTREGLGCCPQNE